MEFLIKEDKNKVAEFDDFINNHPKGSFMQATCWAKVKYTWQYEGIISRDDYGKIKGAMLVLIQKAPAIGTGFLYAPRGPVCNLSDLETLEDLTNGIIQLSKKYNAHVFKCDPDVCVENEKFNGIMISLGYENEKGGLNFETIQPRFNHRINVSEMDEESLLASFQSKTRYNVRLAKRRGVDIKIVDKNHVHEFYTLMEETGLRDDFNIRPQWYFEKILDEMGENARLYMAYFENIPVAGAITIRYGGKTNYVYGASSNEYRNHMPTYLLQYEMMKWAVESGDSIYDMQGVSGDDDDNNPLYGLIRFKRGFSGYTAELLGEYQIVFKPLINKAIDFATKLR